jgi:predicted GNAT family acetyltransferase
MPTHPTVRTFDNAQRFLDCAGPWLRTAEAEHNLLLGIVGQLRSGRHSYEKPVFLATIEQNGAVVGCAFRTPPYKLCVTRMPVEAVPALVDEVGQHYDSIPAVLGPESIARVVGEEWTRRFGGRAEPGMKQRIYQLDRVTPLAHPVSGEMRLATPSDYHLVREWSRAFVDDTGVETPGVERLVTSVIDDGRMGLWLHGGLPRAMAAAAGATDSGMRIGYVYTPPEWRGRGYGSAVTAAVTQRQLDHGYQRCFLYTDLSNPTSNDIYRRLGYEPVCDVMDVRVVP